MIIALHGRTVDRLATVDRNTQFKEKTDSPAGEFGETSLIQLSKQIRQMKSLTVFV
jgi:hypothetical protein